MVLDVEGTSDNFYPYLRKFCSWGLDLIWITFDWTAETWILAGDTFSFLTGSGLFDNFGTANALTGATFGTSTFDTAFLRKVFGSIFYGIVF